MGAVEARRDGNLAMSPANISTVLVMTYLGARGETAVQMQEVLRLDRDVEAMTAAWGQLASSLETSDPGYTVRLANRLFAAPRHAVEPQYVDQIAPSMRPSSHSTLRMPARCLVSTLGSRSERRSESQT
jgi:serpin B